MTYRDQAWTARQGTMGDIAESKFEELCDRGFVRYGLNRPPIQMSALPAQLRYTPDYLTSAGFVEVQGCGRDGTLKFKAEKLAALSQWNGIHPVTLWMWDSHRKQWASVGLEEMYQLIAEHGTLGAFKEGTPYWAVKATAIPNWSKT